VKNHNNVTGNNKIMRPFFDELDAVLGHRPASAPTMVLDASSGGISAEPTEEEEREESDGMSECFTLLSKIQIL
jgi:hypothetical protein